MSKSVRSISPLGFRVVVKIMKSDNQSEGGLYLPEGAKDSMSESILAEVVEVASAIDDRTDEETNISGIPLSSTVLIPKDSGIKIPWDNQLRIVDTSEILALVEEVTLV